MDLALCKQEKFNGVLVDFYRDENNDVFMTREQIGRALEYKNPNDSIRTIHRRNKERLNKFAVSFKLNGTDGKKYDTTVYNSRGVYEICRYSKQPKANAFYDWVYEVLETIRTTGSYAVPRYNLPTSYKEAVQALLEQIEINEKTQEELNKAKPKAEFADAITQCKTNLPIGTFAKIVYRKTGIGRNKLFDWLRDRELLMSIPSEYNQPTQKAIRLGLFETKESIASERDIVVKVAITPKGQLYVYNMLTQYEDTIVALKDKHLIA